MTDASAILVLLIRPKHTIPRPFFRGTGISFMCMRRCLGSNAHIQVISRTYKIPSCGPQVAEHSSRYWDWSLDWENVTQAPVWDTTSGFGGDGDENDIESIHGHCVTDGPFARLQVLYVEKFPYPHCLSRGFAKGDNLTRFSAALKPRALDELLRTPDYATFNLGVEDGPHLSIPRSIHGDFSTVTAPAGLSPCRVLSSV